MLVRTDNTSVVSYINHQGRLRFEHIFRQVQQILLWAEDKFKTSHCLLTETVCPHNSSSFGAGCHCIDVTMADLLPGILTMVHQGRVHPLIVAPFQLARVCFLDLISLLEGISWEIPVGRDLLSLLQGTIYHPKLEIWKL